MSKLNDLITKLCPDGVPYKKLGDLCTIETGRLNANKAVDNGAYPFFTTAEKTSRIDSYRWDTEALLIAGNANVGSVKHYTGKFEAYQRTYVLTNFNQDINVRFLFHFTRAFLKEYLANRSNSAAMTYIVLSTLKNFEIPLPPLPVQEEIVRILDSFTELEAELEAELTGRKEQYEYYRDYLLDEKNLEAMDGKPVETKKLGDVCIRQRGTHITAKQMKEIACADGDILIFGGGKTKVYAKESDIPSKDVITCQSVVVKSRGNIGFEYCDVPFTHKSELWSYSSNDEAVNIKFISYYLENNRRFFQDAANIGKLPQIATGVTDNYDIPLPSLATQERVVDILDRFDALTTSLTDGIPAEIAMRREQYEYYRSRLLDFPRLPEDSDSDGE